MAAWQQLLGGPGKAPLCTGHSQTCLLRTVKRLDSVNRGRQFWVCPQPEGRADQPEARCNFFRWVDHNRGKNKTKN